MDKKQIRKTIKKVQLAEDPEVAKHDELMEANDNLSTINDTLVKLLNTTKKQIEVILQNREKEEPETEDKTSEELNNINDTLSKLLEEQQKECKISVNLILE